MTGNPIIVKELVTVLRSRGAFVLALVSVVALSVLALFMWPQAGINPGGVLYSRLFFAIVLSAELVMLALFTPPFAATSIVGEHESHTWEMLYYSLLRPDHILIGKLVGAVAFLLLLTVISLPVGAICFLLGGVSPHEIFLAYLVLVMAGVTFGLIGLTSSAFVGSSYASLIVTYLALLVICGGVHMPMLLLPEWREGQQLLHAVRCLSPFTALVAITHDAYRSISPAASMEAVVRYFGYSGVLCAVMVIALMLRIAKRPVPHIGKRRGVVDESTPRTVRILRRVFFLIDSRRRRRSISLWINPIFVLDIRTRTAGMGNLLRACFACLIFALGLVIMVSGTYGATGPDVIRLIALAFQIGLIALIGPSLTIGAVASEVEGRTFDQLRMTPLSPTTIFTGRFLAAGALSMMLVVASVPIFFAILYIQEQFNPQYLVSMFTVTLITIVFALSVGFFFSTHCRTTARAAAFAYSVMAFVCVGTLLGVVLRERLSEAAARFVLAFNPIVTAVGSVTERQFRDFGVWQRNVAALGVVSLILIVGTIYRLHRTAGPTEE